MSVFHSIARLPFEALRTGASITKFVRRDRPHSLAGRLFAPTPLRVGAFLAGAFVLSPAFASAFNGDSQAPTACPAAPPSNLAVLAPAWAPEDLQDGAMVEGAASPQQAADALAQARTEEQASFARILSERSAVTVPNPAILALSARQRAELDAEPAPETAVPKIGTAIDVGQAVDFAGLDGARLRPGGESVHGGIAGRTDRGSLVWEMAVASPDAKALRLEFADLALAPGVELYVYNEDGQVWGPYGGSGPDGNGGFWSPSLFGDTARVHLRADDSAALAASHFTLSRVMHLGARVGALQDRIRDRYAVGPVPNDVSFCGAQVPDCTQNAMCWLGANPGLAAAADAVAHLQFVNGGSAYICSGAYLAQSGNAPQQPYLMTANHCFSTSASANSLEAFFKFRTTACDGGCVTRDGVPRVNGATLLATGAIPTSADFTLVRLSGFPAGGARLLGWTAAQVPEGAQLAHLGHPAGSPLAFSYRLYRYNNASLPHASDWDEPTFLYSGLASASSDWAGTTAGGSSGGPALLPTSDGGALFVGQLTGAAGMQDPVNRCDPNATSTVDGAYRASYPSVRRFVYDRIFRGSFETP
ncbi:trypsin-like peptidase domain-containing protein [Dokdonella sp.]|uniref:trypsin-like peptidase domain-containing protein n=1 Tax=Dokdonella sp. TaxID=2291710 RepID=UPI001AFEF421|nr:trypsin-like peptidase domain-containing protein [Dokdonella sp.]MBO9662401.1 hypothetical protein [Dokdonella sp.]